LNKARISRGASLRKFNQQKSACESSVGKIEGKGDRAINRAGAVYNMQMLESALVELAAKHQIVTNVIIDNFDNSEDLL